MKRIISLLLCTVLMATVLVGCGEKDRELYKIVDLNKYVTLGEYKGLKVDTSTKAFEEIYDGLVELDVENGGFYVQKNEGTVEKGDTANIDYVGKKDGIAFEGGTSSGYNLEIGSNSFIEGFEDGLIGKQIGSTVDLNLTFPEDYGSEELAGQDVVFTVTINFVITDEPLPAKEYFEELGFKTLEDYEADVKKNAVYQALFETVEKNSKVNRYPEDDSYTVYNAYYNLMNLQIQSSYGATIDQLIEAQGMTKSEFEQNLFEESVYPEMNKQMIYYCILDNEKLELTDEKIAEMVEAFKNDTGTTATEDELKDNLGSYYFEYAAVKDIVNQFLYANAKIK